MSSSMPIAIGTTLPPTRYVTRVAELVAHPGQMLAK
jgi:hypothetical protein